MRLKKAFEQQSKKDGTSKSLDASVDQAAEAAWNEEIARRIECLNSGKAKTVSLEEVRSRISTKLFASRKARADFKAFDKIMGRRDGKRPRAGDELPLAPGAKKKA